MKILEVLDQYKNNIINLGNTPEEKKFLDNIFIRWYLNSKKTDKDGIIPKNLIDNTALEHLTFANKEQKLHFDINYIKNKSKSIYKSFTNELKQCDIKNEKYTYIPVLNNRQLERLKILYDIKNPNGDKMEFELCRNKLVRLYNFIGINNAHLSIPPIYHGVEMFGTAVNTHNNEYCSPFILEKKFNSLGSFWDYKFHKDGIYLCNPPFDEILMEKMAIKLNKDLKTTKFLVVVVITIPIWDKDSQIKMGIKN